MAENGHVGFIWSIADLLRGDYKQSEYGRVILPLVVIRRLDLVLEPTKAAVVAAYEKHGDKPLLLQKAASGLPFWNTSKLTFTTILGDSDNTAKNLVAYINAFSENALEIIQKFKFFDNVTRLNDDGLLYLVLSEFVKPELDLRPSKVSPTQMGHIFEELIRRFSEQSNETAGEHFTPREVIELMVNLLFIADDETLSVPRHRQDALRPGLRHRRHAIRGGELPARHEPQTRISRSSARSSTTSPTPSASPTCSSRARTQSTSPSATRCRTTAHADSTFDYLLANPPFGVEWKKVEKEVKRRGTRPRDATVASELGCRAINDGSLLFLQHMISKMKPTGGGRQPHRHRLQRLAAVHR